MLIAIDRVSQRGAFQVQTVATQQAGRQQWRIIVLILLFLLLFLIEYLVVVLVAQFAFALFPNHNCRHILDNIQYKYHNMEVCGSVL